uniref:uncharacterized protein LOC114677074 isoform X1 n=1 Tax=Macaca mulatta TaxID=9544 RepID=UPI0010A27081|nr:uncharacterized protein LOC114677074 isoform X1 [Macaca mulatta]
MSTVGRPSSRSTAPWAWTLCPCSTRSARDTEQLGSASPASSLTTSSNPGLWSIRHPGLDSIMSPQRSCPTHRASRASCLKAGPFPTVLSRGSPIKMAPGSSPLSWRPGSSGVWRCSLLHSHMGSGICTMLKILGCVVPVLVCIPL